MAELAYWAVVPAAGIGRRMGGTKPKQYLRLGERTVIEHALERLCAHPAIRGVVVCLSPEDSYWAELGLAPEKLIATARGGEERAHSVLNGLRVLARHAVAEDWVLVHDAVRPCLRREDVDALIRQVGADDVGGLLATAVTDTVKRADGDGRVVETVPREGLWRALTPQMFRLGRLTEAIEQALAAGEAVTDEAAAIERCGERPRLVRGHPDNIKITLPQDLALAEWYLRRQHEASTP